LDYKLLLVQDLIADVLATTVSVLLHI